MSFRVNEQLINIIKTLIKFTKIQDKNILQFNTIVIYSAYIKQ